VRVVIVTMDTHLASAVERARRTLMAEMPGLSISLHAASEWDAEPGALTRCIDDIAQGDIVIGTMLFMEDHFNCGPAGPQGAARAVRCARLRHVGWRGGAS
jgi:magnesium chelatase subunit H